mmetsp:Transcript_106207/g.307385  ORF Transcript_106207/g.307385 Transcript_106207/m.307385 type:complete len:490 (+) Transcript_106207:34-1503(+)
MRATPWGRRGNWRRCAAGSFAADGDDRRSASAPRAVASRAVASKHALDLLERLALRLWHHEFDEHQADEREDQVTEKDSSRRQRVLQHFLQERHDDVRAEVHDRRERQCGTAHLEREDLGDHEPRDRPETDLVAADVHHQSDDCGNSPTPRQADVGGCTVLDGGVGLHADSEDEGGSDEREGYGHHGDAHEKQQAPTVAVDPKDSEQGRHQLHQAHQNGRQGSRAAEASRLEDVRCEVQHRRLPCDLLQEHQSAPDEQLLGVLEGVSPLRGDGGGADRLRDLLPHDSEFLLHLRRLRPPEELQRLFRGACDLAALGQQRTASNSLEHQEPRRLRNEHDANALHEGEGGRHRQHVSPPNLIDVLEQPAEKETQKDAEDDHSLLRRYQGAANLSRRDLGDVDRRRVHREADAESVHQQAGTDGPHRRRDHSDERTAEVKDGGDLHLQFPTEVVRETEAEQRRQACANEIQGADRSLLQVVKPVALSVPIGG